RGGVAYQGVSAVRGGAGAPEGRCVVTTATFRCGHPRTAENAYVNPGSQKTYCRQCRARQARERLAARLSPGQEKLLRRLAATDWAGGDVGDPATLRSLVRRGLVRRVAGQWRATEAGHAWVQKLTAGVS
ncbi:MAG TPA: hypothetical protein VHA75_06580, partial [Rugosimonospora sp.]|nr:hypothetical protein [Rugosimonospora sp.]